MPPCQNRTILESCGFLPTRFALFWLLLISFAFAQRTEEGLIAFYDFSEPTGTRVIDRSGVTPPLHLRISDPANVRRNVGSLDVTGDTLIHTDAPATRIIDTFRRTEAFTIEAWVHPANTKQKGPARIVTISKDTTNRNVTLGQEGNKYDLRIRSADTSNNGLPSIPGPEKTVQLRPQHLVVTRHPNGQSRLYIDGKPSAERTFKGNFSAWDDKMRLGLANEASNNRPWLGTYFLVALYSRALTPSEIADHHRAGPDATIEPRDFSAELFDTHIAGILSRHCIECHDPATREGKLDLTRRSAVLAAGRKTKVLVPGDSHASKLWREVESDNMPEDRPPLSATEKASLKKWIDEGATWTRDVIDPADHWHEDHAKAEYLRRLTIDEYIATVQATFGVDIAKEAREQLPAELRADGFSNTAYNLAVDLKHIQAYARLAEQIVAKIDPVKFAHRFDRNKLLTKKMRPQIAKVGEWVLRGPLKNSEIDLYRGIATTTVSAGGDFREAIAFVLEAMLQSPRFIYRVESQHGGPVTNFEFASRLSYLVWGAPPDPALFEAARHNRLSTPKQIQEQVERMLKDPRAKTRAATFAHEWLNLGRMQNLRPDPKTFPEWSPELAADMRRETLATFTEIAWTQNRPLSELFSAQLTFATPRLAAHYGLPPKKDADADDLESYDLTNVPERIGLLTHGSILTIGGDSASMVTRGLFLLHDLLRGVVRNPPPGIDTTPIPSREGLTQRDAAMERINSAQCGGCHAKFEPLAFALEKFDGIGSYREFDRYNNRLRADGDVLIPGTAKTQPYANIHELATILGNSERVQRTIMHKIVQFGLGRPLGGADAPGLEPIYNEAIENGGSYSATLTALAKSPLFRTSTRS